jgi:UDP-3-O-[3-hydroxymyristoyl] glucosamine N-acyltransferase
LLKFAFNFIGNCAIGINTTIENTYLAKELLEIGSNSYIGKALIANHLWDTHLVIKKIKIDDNVVISDCCCISPGTAIRRNTNLLPLSVTAKNDVISPNSFFFNTPLKRISKQELINVFNFEELDFE